MLEKISPKYCNFGLRKRIVKQPFTKTIKWLNTFQKLSIYQFSLCPIFKGKHVIKKIILKGNITARYTEYKHHNNETTCTSISTSRFNEQ